MRGLTRTWDGRAKGCRDVGFDLYPGEVLGIVGESGSGKTTLLSAVSYQTAPDAGSVWYDTRDQGFTDLAALSGASEAERRTLLRTEWGFVEQNPRDGLRMGVSAGANIGERLMAQGVRHYGRLRQAAWQLAGTGGDRSAAWMTCRPRPFPAACSSACRSPATWSPSRAWCSWTNPPAALDVSVQARLLDLLRGLVRELDLAVVIVTHDLAVARLLADRLLVMRRSRVVESGLTDQMLDDPQHPYTQLLVSSVLQP